MVDYPRVQPYRGRYKPPRKEPKGQQAQKRLHDLVQADKFRSHPKITCDQRDCD